MKVTFFAHEDPTGARVLGAAVSTTLECITKTTVWVSPIKVTFFVHKKLLLLVQACLGGSKYQTGVYHKTRLFGHAVVGHPVFCA